MSQQRFSRPSNSAASKRATSTGVTTEQPSLMLSSKPQDVLQMQRMLGNHSTQQVLQVKHKAPSGVIARRSLGRYSEGTGMFSSINVEVNTRTVTEWRTFLREQASSSAGGQELMAFMAMAMNTYVVRSDRERNYYERVNSPTESEAVDLMEALMTTGSGIDFDEDHAMVVGISDFPVYGNILLGRFNQRFAPLAIARLTARQGRLGSDHARQVQEYIGEGDGNTWGLEMAGRGLIEGALGSAIAAATAFVHYGSDAYLTRQENGQAVLSTDALREIQNKKAELEMVVSNSAMTIRGAILAHRAFEARNAAIRDAIIGAAGSIIPGLINLRYAELARLATGGGTTGIAAAAEPERYRIAFNLAAGNAIRSAAGSAAAKVVTGAAGSRSNMTQDTIEGFRQAMDDVMREMRAGPDVAAVDSNAAATLAASFSQPLNQTI